ncbi:NAD(P)H-binding protein [Roseisolibacter sp. H3M3-2]|uniref:NAD(P)H-binding protein n=1 Tax=Roseisolibacter sp. H3M3-2 TaxID=3031323 RepID=UPI0023DBB135|nr:NAD(P)H-binding protein [Roseisolibacter sp. H3M3-2]
MAGATGYVGDALTRLLASRGASVAAHVRPDSPRLAEWRARCAAARAAADATPWDEDAMAAALAARRPAAVYALLGTTRRRGDGYEAVDYGLTSLLLRAAVRAARDTGTTPRVVYLSAVGADADSRNPYLAVRGRVERELRASGLPWVSARPSFITGPDREESRPAERIAATVTDAALFLPRMIGARRIADRYRSTDAEELARALARLGVDGEGIVTGELLRHG